MFWYPVHELNVFCRVMSAKRFRTSHRRNLGSTVFHALFLSIAAGSSGLDLLGVYAFHLSTEGGWPKSWLLKINLVGGIKNSDNVVRLAHPQILTINAEAKAARLFKENSIALA